LLVSYHSYGVVLPGFVDPDSGLLGFVGPDGLIGFFILPPVDEPPIVEPPIVELLPEGEAPDGLLVEPGEVAPEVPAEGLPGAVVAPPAAPGAVAPPPMAPPLPAAPAAPPPPAPPPPPWAWTDGAKAVSARQRLRAPPIRRPDLRLRFRMICLFLHNFSFEKRQPNPSVRAALLYDADSHSQADGP
jgi:hypothetical protein